jgi:hypothetical protein
MVSTIRICLATITTVIRSKKHAAQLTVTMSRLSLSSPLSPRDRRRNTLFTLTSTIFHRKAFYFVGNFKQFNDNLSQKDIEKAVTGNGGQISPSIHSLTGKNAFLVVASDPNVNHEYTSIARKNKANIVPVSFVIKSLELLANNRSADVNSLVRVVIANVLIS